MNNLCDVRQLPSSYQSHRLITPLEISNVMLSPSTGMGPSSILSVARPVQAKPLQLVRLSVSLETRRYATWVFLFSLVQITWGPTQFFIQLCHLRPKYSDGTRTYEYCSKGCASKAGPHGATNALPNPAGISNMCKVHVSWANNAGLVLTCIISSFATNARNILTEQKPMIIAERVVPKKQNQPASCVWLPQSKIIPTFAVRRAQKPQRLVHRRS